MTSPKSSLNPASGDDRRSFLSALELVAGGDMQLGEIVGTVVGQRMTLEPCPKVFDRIQIGRVRGQEGDLYMPVERIQILAHQEAAMRPQAIPHHQQRLAQVRFERLQERDDFFLLDTALVQPEQAVGASKTSDDRDMIPIEVKLDNRRLALGCPGTNPRRAFADSRLVDEDDQTTFSLGFFLSPGQVRRFQWCTASSLRSIARFSGVCALKPKAPKIRQICVWPNCTPCSRLITTPTRLNVHRSVPKPCSVGFCSTARRTSSSWLSSSLAGRPTPGTARNASIPSSSSSRFHVYTVWRATPTADATSAGRLPANNMRPARTRFFVASSNRFFAMPIIPNQANGN